ncbi:limbic system-associated membrane protein-like isoform X2 [Heptranchias perlo]|uniref:limbic system-associated membrane protein-like isoform X2 n=1 Tax=Heptranchias perlo TaxID=212740 RepID=UPI00355A40FE
MLESGQIILLYKMLLCQIVLNDPFVIRTREHHVTGVLGKSVLLSISQVSGVPIQKITWDKGSYRFINCRKHAPCKIFGEYQKRVECFPDCSLKLLDLQTKDSGVYHATAVATDGQIRYQSVYLDVSVPVSPPKIAVYQDNSSVHHSLTLTCNIGEGSLPQFVWRKDKQQLAGGLRFLLTNGNRSLSIRNFTNSDCGTYTCIVRNGISKKETTRALFGEDDSKCEISNYLITIIAVAICVVGLGLVINFIKKCVNSRTDRNTDLVHLDHSSNPAVHGQKQQRKQHKTIPGPSQQRNGRGNPQRTGQNRHGIRV